MSVTTSIFKSDSKNIYVNASLFNNTTENIPAILETELTNPILDQADKYKMCVVRFDIPLTSLQNNIMNIVSQTIINNPPGFSVGIMYDGKAYYGSFTSINPVTMTDFIQYLNVALQQAYSELQSANTTLSQNMAPYFYYDPISHLFYFVSSNYSYEQGMLTIISQSIFNVMGGFPYFLPGEGAGTNNVVPEGYVGINIYYATWNQVYTDLGFPSTGTGAATSPSGQTYNAIKISQEFNTSYMFNNLSKVVLLTSLPVRSEFLPNGGVVNVGDSSATTSSRIILTDYDVPINYWGDLNQTLYYIPQTLDRWVDMYTNKELSRLSFNFQYENTFGVLNQLFLEPYQRANIKLLFRSIF
jgi:hypothetical protein